MVCLGFEPGAAGWKAQTTPLSYGRNCNGSNAFIQRLLGVYAMKTFQSTITTSEHKLCLVKIMGSLFRRANAIKYF